MAGEGLAFGRSELLAAFDRLAEAAIANGVRLFTEERPLRRASQAHGRVGAQGPWPGRR